MRNLILLLVLANVLYFLWDRFVAEPEQTGVAVVDESELGPPLAISKTTEAAASVGAVLGSGQPSDLAAVVGRSCVSIFFKTNSEAGQEYWRRGTKRDAQRRLRCDRTSRESDARCWPASENRLDRGRRVAHPKAA